MPDPKKFPIWAAGQQGEAALRRPKTFQRGDEDYKTNMEQKAKKKKKGVFLGGGGGGGGGGGVYS